MSYQPGKYDITGIFHIFELQNPVFQHVQFSYQFQQKADNRDENILSMVPKLFFVYTMQLQSAMNHHEEICLFSIAFVQSGKPFLLHD